MKLLGILIPKSNSQFNTINVKGGVLWTTNYWLFDLKIICIEEVGVNQPLFSFINLGRKTAILLR